MWWAFPVMVVCRGLPPPPQQPRRNHQQQQQQENASSPQLPPRPKRGAAKLDRPPPPAAPAGPPPHHSDPAVGAAATSAATSQADATTVTYADGRHELSASGILVLPHCVVLTHPSVLAPFEAAAASGGARPSSPRNGTAAAAAHGTIDDAYRRPQLFAVLETPPPPAQAPPPASSGGSRQSVDRPPPTDDDDDALPPSATLLALRVQHARLPVPAATRALRSLTPRGLGLGADGDGPGSWVSTLPPEPTDASSGGGGGGRSGGAGRDVSVGVLSVAGFVRGEDEPRYAWSEEGAVATTAAAAASADAAAARAFLVRLAAASAAVGGVPRGFPVYLSGNGGNGDISSGADFQTGDDVELWASPFGCQAPNIFLNTLSHGVVAATVPGGGRGGHTQRPVLGISDAAYFPGAEGGAVVLRSSRRCIGRGEKGVSVSIFLALATVLELLGPKPTIAVKPEPSISNTRTTVPSDPRARLPSPLPLPPRPPPPTPPLLRRSTDSTTSPSTLLSPFVAATVRVLIGTSSWGTGVAIGDAGLVLTNAHVVLPALSTSSSSSLSSPIRVQFLPRTTNTTTTTAAAAADATQHASSRAGGGGEDALLFPAMVLFASSDYWDFAVLRVVRLRGQPAPPAGLPEGLVDWGGRPAPSTGSTVYAIGYGGFDPAVEGVGPMVTRGQLGRLVPNPIDGSCYRYQTSAMTLNGASGGALVSLARPTSTSVGVSNSGPSPPAALLVGLLSSNLRLASGLHLTRLSYVVPLRSVLPAVRRFARTGAVSHLAPFGRAAVGIAGSAPPPHDPAALVWRAPPTLLGAGWSERAGGGSGGGTAKAKL
ncbi:hypothetical protein DFJ73DRAFT_800386 [Zopfochytrium polystomum]|nr:hypothetical protein DFJ73DRAFT_800386 [Zopfochytrium polystomum]